MSKALPTVNLVYDYYDLMKGSKLFVCFTIFRYFPEVPKVIGENYRITISKTERDGFIPFSFQRGEVWRNEIGYFNLRNCRSKCLYSEAEKFVRKTLTKKQIESMFSDDDSKPSKSVRR